MGESDFATDNTTPLTESVVTLAGMARPVIYARPTWFGCKYPNFRVV